MLCAVVCRVVAAFFVACRHKCQADRTHRGPQQLCSDAWTGGFHFTSDHKLHINRHFVAALPSRSGKPRGGQCLRVRLSPFTTENSTHSHTVEQPINAVPINMDARLHYVSHFKENADSWQNSTTTEVVFTASRKIAFMRGLWSTKSWNALKKTLFNFDWFSKVLFELWYS